MFGSSRQLGEAPISGPPPAGFYEESGEYVIDLVLTASQEIQKASRNIDSDSDFIWIGKAGTQTGIYEISFTLPSGHEMSSSRIRNANYIGTAQFPVYLEAPVILPASSSLRYSVKDLSVASNTIQIVLIGRKRYRA